MKERGVLFQGEMVCAILEKRKFHTRRIVKWKPREPGLNLKASSLKLAHYFTGKPEHGWVLRSGSNDVTYPAKCPHGVPGQRLWVREAWKVGAHADGLSGSELGRDWHDCVWYPADGDLPDNLGRYRHARFMPRWASRITLDLTAIRAEWLNDITEADAIAEGVSLDADGWYSGPTVYGKVTKFRTAREAYRKLWEHINGQGSWVDNPAVWVEEFREVRP